MRLVAASASGPLGMIAPARSSAPGERLAGVGEAIDEAQRVGALGDDRVAREGELHRDVVRDPRGQPQQAAGRGHQRALDLGQAEAGAAGRDDEVAGQRDLETAGDGEALDRGDQRLGRRAFRDAREAAAARVRPLPGGERLEVHAGAEERRRRRRSRPRAAPASASSRSIASAIAAAVAASIALRASGRSSVTTRIAPAWIAVVTLTRTGSAPARAARAARPGRPRPRRSRAPRRARAPAA